MDGWMEERKLGVRENREDRRTKTRTYQCKSISQVDAGMSVTPLQTLPIMHEPARIKSMLKKGRESAI
jgi:hypothetical protein